MVSVSQIGILGPFLALINWPAVAGGVASFFLLGVLWYSDFLFGKAWRKLQGFEGENPGPPAVMGFVFAILMALVSTLAIAFLGAILDLVYIIAQGPVPQLPELMTGTLRMIFLMVGGFALWIWYFMGLGMNYGFGKKPFSLLLIDGLYPLVGLLILSALMGLWMPTLDASLFQV